MPHNLQPKEVSQTGVNIVKKFEGLHKVMDDGRIRSYRDPAGIWTIGYGHTKGVRSGQHITEEEAETMLIEDLQDAIAGVRRQVNVPLSQNQFDALVSWTFNLGEGNLKSSTMLKRLNNGEYDAVPYEMAKWKKARVDGVLTTLPGLVRRRAAEGTLFTLDTDAGDVTPTTGKVVAPTRNKPLSKSRTIIGSTVAAGSIIVQQLTDALTPLNGSLPYADTALGVLAIFGALLAAYARIDDYRKGDAG